MNFRDNLLHLRASSNMTQEQLAMLLGVSRQSVTKWESERTYPEMDKLLKLCQIFGCTLDDLVQGDLTSAEPHPATAAAGAPAADVFGYDEAMRSFAERVSNGIMVILLAVAASVVFFAGGENGFFGPAIAENMGSTLGVLCLFVGAIGGLALLIPAGMQHAAFVRAHPFIEDFYTEEERTRTRTLFTWELLGGIAAIAIGIGITIFLGDGPYEEVVGIPVLTACIAVGVRFIVHGSMMLGRTNIAQYNETATEVLEPASIENANMPEDRKREMLAAQRVNKRVGAVCGIIMILATIVGLLMLFVPMAQGNHDFAHGPTAYFWLSWVVGGLLCGIATLLIKGFSRE